MSQFEDRQKGQEAKFAFDAEKKFKAEARRNKLVGIWAAELMSLTGDEAKAYAARHGIPARVHATPPKALTLQAYADNFR